MLERIALRENLAEWSSRHTKHFQIDGTPKMVDKLQDRINVLTARFRNALKKSVEGIIEAGRLLI